MNAKKSAPSSVFDTGWSWRELLRFCLLYNLLTALVCLNHTVVAADPGTGVLITPMSDTSTVMPAHGTTSIRPASRWEDGLPAGNGIMGAMLYGDPFADTILVNHCKLWLPLGSREKLPEFGPLLHEFRKIIAERGYRAAHEFFLQKARESGWQGSLIWTDPFHPGFFLRLLQHEFAPVTDYVRVVDYAAGEVRVQWTAASGRFVRKLFVSKPDNTIVCATFGPKGALNLTVKMEDITNQLIIPHIIHTNGWILCHNTYAKGKGGYDAAIRVINHGGTMTADTNGITIRGADSVVLLMRVLPWRTPLPESQAWVTNPEHPDFNRPRQVPRRNSVQIAGKAYNPRWLEWLQRDLAAMPTDYDRLFHPHTIWWSNVFMRVQLDLGGDPAERVMPSELILEKARREQRLTPALLERLYDAGRYVFMCSAGPETPPNLFGIWCGTWAPRWSGDYTTDSNLQLAIEHAYSANLAELMSGFFYLWNSFLPDLRHNARALYGCKGILIGTRASNNGLALHWGPGWPGYMWTVGASWLAHWYYDHYLYTGDEKFLRNVAVPWMKECALFWEDFLRGTEDPITGKYTFRPSYSAENGWGDNASQDIEIVTELLTNLIAACETLGIEKDGIQRWKTMLQKLPPLLINDEGQLKEWSNPTQGEKNNHRHLMHLYGAFESQFFNPDADPVLFEAAKVALFSRVRHTTETATHGYMHMGLAAATLGMGDLAFDRIEMLVKGPSMYSSLVNAHNPGPSILCVDGNGATPEIVNRMLVRSTPGKITLLPALPAALPAGHICGLRARGGFELDIQWQNSRLKQAKITSLLGNPVTLKYGDKTLTLNLKKGETFIWRVD